MIEYAVRRQDWYADQCHKLLQIGLALVASGAAIVALFAKIESLTGITQVLAWSLGLSFFVTGIVLVYLYNRTLAGDHPYRKVVDIHSWYFKYQFPGPPTPHLGKSLKKAIGQVDREAKSIENYFGTFLGNAKDPVSLMREDIEQVAILLILQGYRSRQTRQMSRWLFGGLCVSLVLLILLLGCFLFTSVRMSSSRRATSGVPPQLTSRAAAPAFTTTDQADVVAPATTERQTPAEATQPILDPNAKPALSQVD